MDLSCWRDWFPPYIPPNPSSSDLVAYPSPNEWDITSLHHIINQYLILEYIEIYKSHERLPFMLFWAYPCSVVSFFSVLAFWALSILGAESGLVQNVTVGVFRQRLEESGREKETCEKVKTVFVVWIIFFLRWDVANL